MWRSAMSAAVNTGLSRHIVSSIIARSSRLGDQPPLIVNRSRFLTATRQLCTVSFFPGHRRCLPYAAAKLAGGKYSVPVMAGERRVSLCTAVSVKPAVRVPEQKVAPQEHVGHFRETKKTLPETDPWLLRHQIVTFNRGKCPQRPQGLTFNAGYMDTGADWHETKKAATPTVLAIPGQPGSHEDMLPVVTALHAAHPAHRVIVVNMPGYDFTKGLTAEDIEYFDNSSADLAEFILHFMRALQLSRVDMVVTHSAGSVPLFILVATSDLIKSAMVVCTPSLHVPSRVCRPLWFIKWLVYTWDTPSGRRFLKWFLPKLNNVIEWLNTDDPCQLITTAKFGAYSDFDLMARLSVDVRAKNKPIVYIASKNDRLVELDLSMAWARMLGLDKAMFDMYDEQYKLVKRAQMDRGQVYPKGVVLAKGGHYPQRKEVALPVLRREAVALMAHVLRDQK